MAKDTRLQKMLADCGIASRRKAEEMIASGRVAVNGVRAEIGDKVDVKKDKVTVDGERVQAVEEKLYIMLHKPRGYLTSMSDDRGRKCVSELVEELGVRVYPVGRLDKDTTGLLLVTDDGDYVHRVITPKKHVPKVYFARTDGQPTDADAERFTQGVVLGDGTQCLPARLERLPEQGGCRVTVYEGKYHMVKRMLAGCGTPVLQLHRLSIGALTLDPALSPGAYRELSPEEAMLVFSLPTS